MSALVHFRCRELSGYWGGTGGYLGAVGTGREGVAPGRSQIQALLCSKPGRIFSCNAATVCCCYCRGLQHRVVCTGGQLEWKQHCPKPTTHRARPAFPALSTLPDIFIQIFSSKYFPRSVRSFLPFYLVGSFWSFSVVFGLFRFYLAPFSNCWYFLVLLGSVFVGMF